MLPFEFVIMGPPVSQQTRLRARRHAWVEQLRAVITSRWPTDDPPVTIAVHVEITHAFPGISGDLDNLAKPVLDALQGLAYEDDRQVIDLTMRKRDLTRDLRIDSLRPMLIAAFNRGDEFLHVVVEEAPTRGS
jgi:Holliday junction resolvase RusA-like endonuclease